MNRVEKALDYLFGFNREKINLPKCIELLQEEKDNPVALCWLSYCSRVHKHFKLDYEITEEIFNRLLQLQNDAQVQNCIGYCYTHGRGTEQDEWKGQYWYTLSAEQGNSIAQNNLGYRYYLEKDLEKAIYWYTLSAEQGNSYAQANMGEYFFYDKKDHEKALYWYTLSAEQGNDSAQFSLGYSYMESRGAGQDVQKGLYWYTLSTEQGNRYAQRNLGIHFEHGRGISKDLEKAFYWYTLSAEQSDPISQFKLGSCYEHGKGTVQDLEKAVYWYSLSANQGNARASLALRYLSNTNIDVEKIAFLPKEHNPMTMSPDMLCCICATNVRNIVCLPCRHVPTCFNCVQELVKVKRECPICRGEIKQVVKLFL